MTPSATRAASATCSGVEITPFASPYWVTFRQARERCGSVRKGEKGRPILFWKILEKRDEESGELIGIPMPRYYTVFSVEQCDGLNVPKVETVPISPIERAEEILAGFPTPAPAIAHSGSRAAYSPSQDRVQLPAREAFDPAEEYYSTAFHELAHATGHISRLARKSLADVNSYDQHDYT